MKERTIWVFVGILMIVTGSLVVQKHVYDFIALEREAEIESRLKSYTNQRDRMMTVIRILRVQVPPPKNESRLVPVVEGAMSYFYSDQVYSYSFTGVRYWYIDPEHVCQESICCTRIEPDYVKYIIYIPGEGLTIVWTNEVIK